MERALRARGFCAIAGVDEVGRGSLFGAVFAAAVILSPDRPIRGLNDSKQLTAEVQRRAMQAATILEPLLIVAMGGVVMLIVLAVLLPIIQLNTWVK